jgi:hypothetical protein
MIGVFPNSVIFASKNISFLYFLNSYETNLNSSIFYKPSGNIISAPESIYAFDLSIVAYIPSTLLASVLAQIINYPFEHSSLL